MRTARIERTLDWRASSVCTAPCEVNETLPMPTRSLDTFGVMTGATTPTIGEPLDLTALRSALREAADPRHAEPMARYMKNQFPFFGVKAPDRRKAAKDFVVLGAVLPEAQMLELASEMWRQDEREFAYVAVDMLRRGARQLSAEALEPARVLVTTKSWWDTVDLLAAHVVGPIVRRHPHLSADMDSWIDSDDIWQARSAILHQLTWKQDTDPDRLFEYCRRRAGDTEFFIRKAIGWALREYARTDPVAVRTFVDGEGDRLSGLTSREALKHFADGGR